MLKVLKNRQNCDKIQLIMGRKRKGCIYMEITKKDIEHIATLSMLNLSENEIEGYTKDLQNIVAFAEQIQEVDTENVAESAFALDAYNVFRKDEVKGSFDRDLLLSNAPSSNGVQYQLPPVIVD